MVFDNAETAGIAIERIPCNQRIRPHFTKSCHGISGITVCKTKSVFFCVLMLNIVILKNISSVKAGTAMALSVDFIIPHKGNIPFRMAACTAVEIHQNNEAVIYRVVFKKNSKIC